MFESSFRLGTIAGIRIGVHYTWFIIFFLLSSSLFALFSQEHAAWSVTTRMLTAMVTTLIFFLSIILHELGHSLVAIAHGIRVRSITLFIFGGVAQTEEEAKTAATEFWIAIAGPLVSFTLAGLFFLLKLLFAPYSDIVTESLDWLMTINLVVAIFNLVPGFPLDGGRVLRAIIWWLTGNASIGMQWAVFGGKLFAYGLMFLGMMSVLLTGLLLNGLWLIGIGWFLFSAAEASGRAFIIEHLIADVKVGDVMRVDLPTVSADMMILDWVDQRVLLSGQRACLVTEGQRIIGLATLSDAGKLARQAWSTTSVYDIMTPLQRLYTVRPSDSVTEALKLMNQYGIHQVPVLENEQVVGWVERQHLLQVIQLHSETGR